MHPSSGYAPLSLRAFCLPFAPLLTSPSAEFSTCYSYRSTRFAALPSGRRAASRRFRILPFRDRGQTPIATLTRSLLIKYSAFTFVAHSPRSLAHLWGNLTEIRHTAATAKVFHREPGHDFFRSRKGNVSTLSRWIKKGVLILARCER